MIKSVDFPILADKLQAVVDILRESKISPTMYDASYTIPDLGMFVTNGKDLCCYLKFEFYINVNEHPDTGRKVAEVLDK